MLNSRCIRIAFSLFRIFVPTIIHTSMTPDSFPIEVKFHSETLSPTITLVCNDQVDSVDLTRHLHQLFEEGKFIVQTKQNGLALNLSIVGITGDIAFSELYFSEQEHLQFLNKMNAAEKVNVLAGFYVNTGLLTVQDQHVLSAVRYEHGQDLWG